MSEELAYEHAAAGVPNEPALSPTQPVTQPVASVSKRKFVPGGGSALAKGDLPGDPFATLVVLAADAILGSAPSNSKITPELDHALKAALKLIEGADRSVAIVAGGNISSTLMTEVVLRMPGGLDSFGPGRRVQALLKERSAPWGSPFESALLTKALAKRQASTVRFGSVVVLCTSCLAEPLLRVYKHCFSDWRVLVDGGRCRGGRDDPLDVSVHVVDAGGASSLETSSSAAVADGETLRARAAAFDDAWFENGLSKYAVHPWWPRASADEQEGQQEGQASAEEEAEGASSKKAARRA